MEKRNPAVAYSDLEVGLEARIPFAYILLTFDDTFNFFIRKYDNFLNILSRYFSFLMSSIFVLRVIFIIIGIKGKYFDLFNSLIVMKYHTEEKNLEITNSDRIDNLNITSRNQSTNSIKRHSINSTNNKNKTKENLNFSKNFDSDQQNSISNKADSQIKKSLLSVESLEKENNDDIVRENSEKFTQSKLNHNYERLYFGYLDYLLLCCRLTKRIRFKNHVYNQTKKKYFNVFHQYTSYESNFLINSFITSKFQNEIFNRVFDDYIYKDNINEINHNDNLNAVIKRNSIMELNNNTIINLDYNNKVSNNLTKKDFSGNHLISLKNNSFEECHYQENSAVLPFSKIIHFKNA